MQSIKDFSSRINYTYVIIGLVLILSIYVLYSILSKNSSNYTIQTNALTERFEDNKNSEDKGEIVLYYAMWCGFSRSFLPEWEKFEIYAKENLPGIKVIRMQCEDGLEKACQLKGVEQFPMVIYYPVGKNQVMFEKERTMDKLIEFVNENI